MSDKPKDVKKPKDVVTDNQKLKARNKSSASVKKGGGARGVIVAVLFAVGLEYYVHRYISNDPKKKEE